MRENFHPVAKLRVARGDETAEALDLDGAEAARTVGLDAVVVTERRHLDGELPEPDVPIEPFREDDAVAFHAALEEAFADHWEPHPEPFESWWKVSAHKYFTGQTRNVDIDAALEGGDGPTDPPPAAPTHLGTFADLLSKKKKSKRWRMR